MNNVHFTSNSSTWQTPPSIYDPLNKNFAFDLDPCCTHKSAKCKKHFTEEEDGLVQDWGGHSVFMNPPYGRQIKDWVKKAFEESKKPNTTVVCLIPARTDTKWWFDYCVHGEIIFLKGRIKFINEDNMPVNSAPFPSAIVIFGKWARPETIYITQKTLWML